MPSIREQTCPKNLLVKTHNSKDGERNHEPIAMERSIERLESRPSAPTFRFSKPSAPGEFGRATARFRGQRHKVELYVLTGDVYAEPLDVGRGGWTWYSGSAGWPYRAGLESILSFRVGGQVLCVDPSIPRNWPGYSIDFRYDSAT